ncbi:hypothetical protein [Bradyrhizobium sp. HKCCYLR20261]|uniref:hypothetical protein n=1 Tax=Bradyrhizobium sp. HKCCYLR20261 TaxID=3420760 RepID=UPI003EBA2EFD
MLGDIPEAAGRTADRVFHRVDNIFDGIDRIIDCVFYKVFNVIPPAHLILLGLCERGGVVS